MTAAEALHIIRHPEDYCAASRQEARTIIADGYEAAQERVKALENAFNAVDLAFVDDERVPISSRLASAIFSMRDVIAATEPKEKAE